MWVRAAARVRGPTMRRASLAYSIFLFRLLFFRVISTTFFFDLSRLFVSRHNVTAFPRSAYFSVLALSNMPKSIKKIKKNETTSSHDSDQRVIEIYTHARRTRAHEHAAAAAAER